MSLSLHRQLEGKFLKCPGASTAEKLELKRRKLTRKDAREGQVRGCIKFRLPKASKDAVDLKLRVIEKR